MKKWTIKQANFETNLIYHYFLTIDIIFINENNKVVVWWSPFGNMDPISQSLFKIEHVCREEYPIRPENRGRGSNRTYNNLDNSPGLDT